MPRYRVTGTTTITFDFISFHEPGSMFEDEIDPVQEERLLAGGHIVLLESASEPEPTE